MEQKDWIKLQGQRVIQAQLGAYVTRSEEEDCYILIIPSLDVLATSRTLKEVQEYATEQVDQLWRDFMNLGEVQFYEELSKLGWQKPSLPGQKKRTWPPVDTNELQDKYHLNLQDAMSFNLPLKPAAA